MRTRPRLLLLAPLPLACLLACEAARSPAPRATRSSAPIAAAEDEATSTPDEPRAARTPPGSYDEALAQLDSALEYDLRVAERTPKGWITLERAAGRLLERAALTGSFDDYARAEELIDRAFAIGRAGAGPFATRARLNFSLHRLPRVDPDLEAMSRRISQDNHYKARLAGLRADVAFQRGQYADALAGYEEALALREDFTGIVRLAHYRWKTADFDGALALYAKAEALLEDEPGRTLAWLHLQRGLMCLDRGRYDEAMTHYDASAAALPGYWLVDEHIAEILTLQGKTDEALARYRDIVERTGNPEFMDAIAGILLERGEEREGQLMVARARAAYDAMLARYPEAAYGHALEHFLEFGSQERALTLARENHALRPGADAKILLAQALLGAGEVKEARARIDEALASPIRTADLHRTAAAVARAEGDETGALAQEALARAINPRALE
ncbi:MAG: hypothetical protein R3A51_18580 [Nannocystaceae bacterium]|nr:hypothetical protein [Myxococcales bacterium]